MDRAKVEKALEVARELYDRSHYVAAHRIIKLLEEALREAPGDRPG